MGRKRNRQHTTEPINALHNFNPDLWQKLDTYQRAYTKSVKNHSITFCDAKSGTGKTTIAVMLALTALANNPNQCGKIIYCRFVDDRFLKEGFIPGDATPEGKDKGLYQPFFDACTELDISEFQLEMMRRNGQIELVTDRALRGTNIKDAFVIIDEAQNAREIEDLLLVLTRIHTHNSKVIVIGHSAQNDNKKSWQSKRLHYNVFQAFAYHFTKKTWANTVSLVTDYRGEISQWADQIWDSLEEI